MNFQNKVAIITGSSTGIGFTTAELLLQKGAKVVLNGRSKNKLDAAEEELKEKGEVLAVLGDMSKEEDVKLLIDKAVETFGGIDILICNAGIKFEDSFQRTDVHALRKIMDVNFMGKVLPITYALPALMESQGSVILISSLAGLYGLPGAVIYSASKKALTAIQQGLYLELSKYKIHTGIMYVGLTENDPKSSIMSGDGKSDPIPDRGLPRQPRAVVANTILKMIQNRTRRKVMTGMGVGLDILQRYFPSLLRMVMKRRLKQIEDMLSPKAEVVSNS